MKQISVLLYFPLNNIQIRNYKNRRMAANHDRGMFKHYTKIGIVKYFGLVIVIRTLRSFHVEVWAITNYLFAKNKIQYIWGLCWTILLDGIMRIFIYLQVLLIIFLICENNTFQKAMEKKRKPVYRRSLRNRKLWVMVIA